MTAAACQTCRELIGGYVLDALEPAERDFVRSHIATCEACAREHAELATLPALLDAADPEPVPLRPPARLEEAVLDSFAREHRGAPPRGIAPTPSEPGGDQPAGDELDRRRAGRLGRRRPRLVPMLAVAAACAAALLIAVLALNGGSGGGKGDNPVALGSSIYNVALTGTGETPAAMGKAHLYPGESGTGVHLEVSGLEPRNYDYELWCVRDDGWKISAGTFRVDANGHADVHLTTAAHPDEYDGLSVQARPAGAARAPHPTRVLTGRLRS